MVVARVRESRRAGGTEREILERDREREWSCGGEIVEQRGFSDCVCERRKMYEMGNGMKGRKAVEAREGGLV